MFLSQKEQTNCSNFSSGSYIESPSAGNWSSEGTTCLFWSIVQNEDLRKISITAIMPLFTFSLVFNLCLFLGIKKSEDLSWNPRYMLLKNLTVSDLLLTLSVGFPALYCLLRRETLHFSMRCVVQYFMMMVANFNSLLTSAFMALERYIYTCHGIQYLVIMTDMRLYSCIILIWLFAVAGAGTSTVLLLMGGARFGHIIPGFVCEPEVVQAQLEQSEHFETFNKIYIASVLLFCLLMFTFCYGRMYLEARQMQQRYQQDNARTRSTIFFYFVIFLLQLLPSIIKLISMCVKNVDNPLFMVILVLIPPCVNPVAYGIRNIEVREALGCLSLSKKIKKLFKLT
ncbi:Olfactory receptor 2AG1 [Bagarius yarrelli]|uniref:Olfactory receptor 2AG1 n=1 Tax=Bagarius yarrelli TaxID=175774 RepID=A0A556TWU9_BAGYA|nr:Olfactory receptor 2AG1 [Bagarius yarrelli]